MNKSSYKPRRTSTHAEDIALIGKCVLHPKSALKVVQWRDVYYYLDGSYKKQWDLDKLVYFYPDKAHALFVQGFKTNVKSRKFT